MTKAELITAFSKAARRRSKAPGPDQVSDALLSAAPEATARHALPLLTKCSLAGWHPLALKGATAVAIYKGKGDRRTMSSFRSILLENNLAKHHHAYLRNQLLDILAPTALASQCSGRLRRGVGVASLCLRIA